MDRLVPRHRRRAGSGPPAPALIAWVGADPYLREAAATLSQRRAMALPLPSHTRAAKAAIAACFVLTCGAVLGVTTIINHGREAALYEASTPSLHQGGTGAPAPDAPPTVRVEQGSAPAPATIPVGVAPALAERATPRPSAASIPTRKQPTRKQPTSKQPSPDPAADPVTPQELDRPADAPAKPTGAHPGKPAVPGRRAVPTIDEEPAQRSAGRPRTDIVHEQFARTHELLEKFHPGAAAQPR